MILKVMQRHTNTLLGHVHTVLFRRAKQSKVELCVTVEYRHSELTEGSHILRW